MIGILCAGVWIAGSDSALLSLSPFSPASSTKNASKSPLESGVISIADQSAGSEVVVESVTVPPPGVWVAVRERQGNMLGNVLGATRITGPRTRVSVSLLRATEPGLSYAVELYRDDVGGEFDLTADSVYVDFATGAPVIAYFNAQ